MKKTIIQGLFPSLFLAAVVSSAIAQGTVTFNTFNGANSAMGQVFFHDDVAPGPAFAGQLWWSDTSNGSFNALGTPQTFDSVNPTYILDGSVPLPARDAGMTVWFQLRVWNWSAGSTWEQAAAGSGYVGISANRSRVLGGVDTEGNPFAPQQFNTFPNFVLVPEPATFGLMGAGLVALFLLRRRS